MMVGYLQWQFCVLVMEDFEEVTRGAMTKTSNPQKLQTVRYIAFKILNLILFVPRQEVYLVLFNQKGSVLIN